MKASDYIADFLAKQGITHVFELIGGMITFMIDAIHQQGNIQIVSMHHEQGAALAAEGFARMTGLPGVALATSGPGATNLLTAIGSCYFDSVPAVFITGQVNRHEQKRSRQVRQLGFQETDIVSMARPVTKAAWLVEDPQMLPALLEEAFRLAVSGRPGPVLIDIPMDVQRAEIAPPQSCSSWDMPDFWSDFLQALKPSRHPLILAGGGINAARAGDALRALVPQLGIPVIHSLMAVDLLPGQDPLRVGMIGSYGNRWANVAFSECDLLLILGSRLDVRQTGANPQEISQGRRLYHVDCEAGEINNRVTGCQALVADLTEFLTYAAANLPPLPAQNADSFRPWLTHINELRQQWPDDQELHGADGINPNVFMRALSLHSQRAAAFVTDVGQHQMWAAQSLRLQDGQRFLTSGGMGAMGFALPAAIGAAFAARQPIVVIAGDGGAQINIQELQTIVRNRLPLKIVILNNQCHGMVRQFQDSYFSGRLQSSAWGYSAPNFCALATAYGIATLELNDFAQLDQALQALWADPASPFLLEVKIAPTTNVYPKLAFGKSLAEMEPMVQPTEMEGT